MKTMRLRSAPTYSMKLVGKDRGRIRLTSGKFEGISYTIHSFAFTKTGLSFQYVFFRIPKVLKPQMSDSRIRKQFNTAVRNIIYNAVISAVNNAH